MAYRAGTAFIEIAPSLRGAQSKIAAEVKTWRAIPVKVDADTTKARAEMDALAKSRTANVVATVDARSARLELDELGRDRHATVHVNADTRGAQRSMSRLGAIMTAIGIASPLAGPVGAAAIGGGGALAGIGVGVGAGVGGFAAIAGAQVKRAKELQKQVVAANKQVATAQRNLANATTPGQRLGDRKTLAEAVQTRDAAQAAISPAQKRLLGGMDALTSRWQKFLASGGGTSVIKPMVAGMKALGNALPAVSKFLRPVSSAVGDLFKTVGKSTGSKGFQSFASTLGKFSGRLLRDAGPAIVNIAKGFGGLLKAFMPLSKSMSKGLLDLTKRFAGWAGGLSKSKGFQSFVGYVRKYGPMVLSTIKDIGVVIGKLVVGLAPLGGAMLKGLHSAFGFLAKLSPHQLAAIAMGIGGVVVAVKAWALGVKAVAAVTKAWSIAQWLLNAAMDANPITLVAVGLVALGAGLVIAYKKSATFRKIVNGAWTAVKAVALGVVTWFHDKFVPFFTTTIPNAFHATVKWVQNRWGDVKTALMVPVNAAKSAIGTAVAKIRSIFTAVKDWVVSAFKREWAGIKLIFTNPVQAAKNVFDNTLGRSGTVRAIFTGIHDWVTGAFNRLWGGLKKVFTDPVQAAKDAFQTLLGKGGPIRSAFSNAVDAIGNIWDGLRRAAGKPVNFVIGTVYNNGIRKALNLLPGVNLKPAKLVKFADGGVMPGYTPGEDVHHFYSPTAGSLSLSGGEAIMRPEWTRAVGGAGAVDRMNAAARRGVMHATGQGFANGGLFRPVRHGHPGGIHDQYTGFPAVDVAVPVGSTVAAGAAGRVTKSYDIRGYEPRRRGPQDGYRSYGRVIQILSNGFSTLYAHLSRRGVHVGQNVAGGQVIGLSGNTGNTTGPHLHFGARGISPLAFFGGSTNYTGSLGSGGSSAGAGYSGVSLARMASLLNPASWVKKLAGMGGYGPLLGDTVKSIAGSAKDYAFGKIHAAIRAARRFAGDVVGAVGHGYKTLGHGSVADQVRAYANIRGWGQGAEWAALSNIISSESGWNPRAQNPTSTAYGLFQFLDSTWGAYGAHKSSDPRVQIPAGLRYIGSRYRDPIGAWNFHKSHGWYDDGGMLPPGLSLAYNGTGAGEHKAVLTSAQWATLQKLGERGGAQPAGVHMENVYTADPNELLRKLRAEQHKATVMARVPL